MRKEKSLKNFITSIIPYIILLLLGFLRVNIFLKYLGDEKYALNQLFYQIFIYLSLAEAGAGTYIIQLYYKCFAEQNKEEIINIYNSAKKILKKIAMIIMLVGIVISFFLKLFTNNNLSLLYMQIVFFLFLLKNVIDYLMMAPKSVIEADQKVYKINVRYYGMKIFEYVVDIVLLCLGFDYIIILIGEILTRFLSYYVTNKKIFKEYDWLKNKPTENKKIEGVGNVFWHRISEAIHYNTDIIITSSFLSPLLVTIYSSYNYITKYLTDIVDMIGTAIAPSFGNSIYKDEKNNMIKIFEEINTFYLFLASFLSIMVYILSNSFVANVWLEKKYLINDTALIFLTINFFIVVARKPINIIRNSMGLFKETKVIVLLEAVVNLILSLILVSKYKLAGILIATCISMVTTTLWYLPYYIYKKKLETKLMPYYIKLFSVFVFSAIIGVISNNIINNLNISGLLSWIIVAIISSLVILLILSLFFMIFFKNFKDIIQKVISMFRRKIK